MTSSSVRGAGEERAVLGRGTRRPRPAPARRPAPGAREQLVEVPDHLALRLEVLGRHRLDGVRQPLAHPVEHAPAEPVEQGLEPLARLAVDEVVVLERADPGADVGRQRVEAVEPLRGDAAQHPLELGIGRAAPSAASPRRRSASAPAAGRPRRAAAGRRPAPARRSRRARAGRRPAGRPAVPLPEDSSRRRSRSRSRRSRRPRRSPRDGSPARHPAVHQVAQGLGQVAVLEQVVGQRVDDLVRVRSGTSCEPSQRGTARAGQRGASRADAAAGPRGPRCRGSGVRKAIERAPARLSAGTTTPDGAAVLVQPALEVQALEQELDRGRDERRLLGAVGRIERAQALRPRRACPGPRASSGRSRGTARARRSRARARPRTPRCTGVQPVDRRATVERREHAPSSRAARRSAPRACRRPPSRPRPCRSSTRGRRRGR